MRLGKLNQGKQIKKLIIRTDIHVTILPEVFFRVHQV